MTKIGIKKKIKKMKQERKKMSNEESLYREYGEIVRRYKSGEEAAFEEMYEKSRRLVYATCKGILGNEEDAKDAMQETYITVYNKVGELSDEDKFLGWLKRVAASKALDMYRKKKGDVSYEDTIESEEMITGDDNLETLPDTYIMDKTKRDTLNDLIRKSLSDVQYQTVILHYYDELPVETIAKLMNCPEGTVKTRLKSSRIKIKSAVKDYEDENNDSLAALGALPFLTRFFGETSKTIKIPHVRLPIKKATVKGAKKVKAAQKPTGAAAKAASKGILGTVGGKIAAGGLALVLIATGAVIISNVVKKDEPNRRDKDDDDTYEVTETSEDTEVAPADTEETEDATGETVLLAEPVELSLDEVSEPDQLERFTRLWGVHDYDRTSVPDDLLSYLYFSDGGPYIDLSMYFEDHSGNAGFVDPSGLFIQDMCYRFSYDELVWTEINILNIPEEDIERVNSNINMDLTGPSGVRGGRYLADDGYVYYEKGEAGNSVTEDILSIRFDGQYYYVTTNEYDMMFEASDPNFDPMTDGTRYLYTMELKNIDGKDYWTIIKCEPAPFEDETTEETVEDISFVPDGEVDFRTLEDNGWKAAFLEKASSITTSEFGNGNLRFPDDAQIKFDLLFINGDDVPELACCIQDVNGGTYINLYSFVDGEVIKLGDSLYAYKIMACYAPYKNMVSVGAISGAGSVVSSEYMYMSDDGTVLDKVNYTMTRYDKDKYSSVEEAMEAGEYDEDVWYSYKRDDETNTSVRMTDEESAELSEISQNMEGINGYLFKTYDELAAMVG